MSTSSGARALIIILVLVLAFIATLTESFASGKNKTNIKKQHSNTNYHHPESTALSFASASIVIANPFKNEEKDGQRKQKHNILHVESVTEYKEKVVDEKESITVVRFYSKYCRSCRASEPLFYKLAADFQQQQQQQHRVKVKFVEVPLNKDTRILHEALGVPSLPWTHIYHPDAGLVEERKVSKKYIDEVGNCLRCYVYGECDLDDAPADCMNIYGECAIDI
eukprot:829505_1